jgi:hypothetical protein
VKFRITKAWCTKAAEAEKGYDIAAGLPSGATLVLYESWRPVISWESWYEVSSRGRVRTRERQVPNIDPHGRHTVRILKSIILKQTKNRRGHYRVMLSVDGRGRKHAYVHTLVAEAFIGPRPPGHLVCHRYDRKSNNHASDLYYGTRKQNAQDALQHGCHGTERHRRAKRRSSSAWRPTPSTASSNASAPSNASSAPRHRSR